MLGMHERGAMVVLYERKILSEQQAKPIHFCKESVEIQMNKKLHVCPTRPS